MEIVSVQEEKGKAKRRPRRETGGGGGEGCDEEGGLKEVSKAKHEREVPRGLGARAEAIEVPDWLTSVVRNSTGGGSRQSWSHDIWGRAPSMAVNKDEQEGESEAAGCSVQLQPHYHSRNTQLHNSCGLKLQRTI